MNKDSKHVLIVVINCAVIIIAGFCSVLYYKRIEYNNSLKESPFMPKDSESVERLDELANLTIFNEITSIAVLLAGLVFLIIYVRKNKYVEDEG